MTRFTLFVNHETNNGTDTFNIIAQDIESGRRLSLTTSIESTDDMYGHQPIREKQNRRILAIENHLNDGGVLNSQHWVEVEPAKDSPAYKIAVEAGLIN